MTRAPHVRTRTTTECWARHSTWWTVSRQPLKLKARGSCAHLREAENRRIARGGRLCQLSFGPEATSWQFRRSPELSEERVGPGDGRNDSLANEERESLPSGFDGFAGLASLRQDP